MVSALKSQKQLVTVSEWQTLGESNAFPPESHIELIEGEVFEMSPIGFKHSGHLNRLNALLSFKIQNRAVISVQNPVQLGDLSEPEPDLTLLKFTADFYSSRHPQPKDVLLLVEVSDSTLIFDRYQKMRLYAAHQIPEYWILNLQDDCLEVYRQPHATGYAEKRELHAGDNINLLAFDDICVQVKELFQ